VDLLLVRSGGEFLRTETGRKVAPPWASQNSDKTMPTTALTHSGRWDSSTLQQMRAYKRKKSDATIAKHVVLLEEAAAANDGVVPPYKWLNEHGLFASYQTMLDYPAAFAHLKRESDKKFEIYRAHNTVAEILPPQRPPAILPPNKEVHGLADYNVNGARFNPTELVIDAGLAEGEWMEVGVHWHTFANQPFEAVLCHDPGPHK
jgi:hypothetical protein